MVIAGLHWCVLDDKPQMFQYLLDRSKLISVEIKMQREDMDATTRSFFREQRRELFPEWGIVQRRFKGMQFSKVSDVRIIVTCCIIDGCAKHAGVRERKTMREEEECRTPTTTTSGK